MKRIGVFLYAALFGFTACVTTSSGSMERHAGDNESEILIRRSESPINAGFKERIYVDGVQKLVLANGDAGRIIVPNGNHTIYAELYTMTTEKIDFTADSNTVKLMITPYSVRDFVIESDDYADNTPLPTVASAKPVAASKPSRPSTPQYESNSVEGSLERAADKLMEKIPSKSRIAIVYVTSNDSEVTEYIANELEFIMVENGLTMIDRSQLDRIRKEQNFQLSGDVDDDQAISIGKIAGANIIITGAVTGTGNLRRLRLRALDTQTAQVLTAASERY
jgi:predicted nucleic acid-binding protein